MTEKIEPESEVEIDVLLKQVMIIFTAGVVLFTIPIVIFIL